MINSKLSINPAQLACVKPAASVRSEPGSNSHIKWLFILSAITHKRIFLRFLYDTPDFISFFILLQSTSAILSAYPLIFCLFTLLYNSLAGTLPRSVSPCIWHHPPLVNTIFKIFLIFFAIFCNFLKNSLFLFQFLLGLFKFLLLFARISLIMPLNFATRRGDSCPSLSYNNKESKLQQK